MPVPRIVSVKRMGSGRVLITFSEAVNGAASLAGYSIENGTVVSVSVPSDKKSVTLTVDTSSAIGDAFNISITGITSVSDGSALFPNEVTVPGYGFLAGGAAGAITATVVRVKKPSLSGVIGFPADAPKRQEPPTEPEPEPTEDTTPPSIVQVNAKNGTSLVVHFSEPVLMDDSEHGALNLSNYRVDGLLLKRAIKQSEKSVRFVTSEQEAGRVYVLVVNNIHDLAGNEID